MAVMHIHTTPRKDGKQKVVFCFETGRRFVKLLTPKQVEEQKPKYEEVQYYR